MDYGDIPAWLALALSIVTFIIQHFNQKRIEADEVTRSLQASLERDHLKDSARTQLINSNRKLRLEKMIQDLEEIIALALQYWTSPGKEGTTSALMIKVKLRDYSSRCTEYRSFLWASAEADFSMFRRHITGGAFEVLSRPALRANDPLLSTATRQAGELRNNLRRLCDQLDSVL